MSTAINAPLPVETAVEVRRAELHQFLSDASEMVGFSQRMRRQHFGPPPRSHSGMASRGDSSDDGKQSQQQQWQQQQQQQQQQGQRQGQELSQHMARSVAPVHSNEHGEEAASGQEDDEADDNESYHVDLSSGIGVLVEEEVPEEDEDAYDGGQRCDTREETLMLRAEDFY